ncbi:hypothetical protein D3C79_642920 [compost metagenome]
MFWHMRLHEDGTFLWIDATGQVQRQRIQGGFTQLLCILTHGDGMQIDDAVDAIKLVLQLHPLAQRPHVVADSQFTGRLRAAENDGLTHS